MDLGIFRGDGLNQRAIQAINQDPRRALRAHVNMAGFVLSDCAVGSPKDGSRRQPSPIRNNLVRPFTVSCEETPLRLFAVGVITPRIGRRRKSRQGRCSRRRNE